MSLVPIQNSKPPNTPKSSGGFNFLFLPLLGPSFLCIIIIGNPRNFFRFAKGMEQQIRTKYLKNTPLEKIGSSLSAKPLLVPLTYSGIQGILTGLRGVDDDPNTIAAGTMTGVLYKATTTRNLLSCGVGGLTGFLVSSLYCYLKSSKVMKDNKINENENRNENFDGDDEWKPK